MGMLSYLARRIVLLIPTIFAISVIAFVVIQLPPGDYLTTYVATLASQGSEGVDSSTLAALRAQYGLDQPIYVQYAKWAWNALHGDFGYSFDWRRPVSTLIWTGWG